MRLIEKITYDFDSTVDKRFPIDELKDLYEYNIEWISPKEFLDYADFKRFVVDYDKVESYYNSLNNNSKIPTPILIFNDINKRHKAIFSDGTHRVLSLQKYGIKEIPVLVFYDI